MATLQEAVVTQTVTREKKRTVMRLNINATPKIKEGETRIKSGFLFLPKEIKDEWRWLERAKWEEGVMRQSYYTDANGMPCKEHYFLCWYPTKWINS